MARDEGRAGRALRANFWPTAAPGLKLRLGLILLLSLVSSSLAAIAPLFLRALIGAVSSPTRLMVPIALVVAYPLTRCVGLGLIQLRVVLTAAVMEGVKSRFAVAAFDHFLHLGRAFHLDHNTGVLARILDRGAAGLETSIRSTHIVVFQVLLEAALVCVVLARVISMGFASILLAVMMGYACVAIVFTARQVRERKRRNTQENVASGRAFESLINTDLVSAFGREPHEVRRYANARACLTEVAVRVQALNSSMNVGWQAIEALALGAILAIAASQVLAGRMRVAELVLVQVYMMQVFANMTGLGYVYADARQGFLDLSELQSMLDQPAATRDAPGAPALKVACGRIVFDRVSFGYGPDRLALGDVSLEIAPGATLALVGASGAGKSTLAHLLLRSYDPGSGAILIDGQDIRSVSRDSLRAAIGVVSQETQLFNDTIGFNIRYGRLDASHAEVADAARRAAIGRFVANLPQGYETLIGERGLKLSGGERQRIAIARLFLERPPIFLFDEATSSVDSLTEAEIQASLRDVSAGRTTLVIAHRLSTVTGADQIAVLDRGRVVELGDHRGLLRRGGRYAELWEWQARTERVLGPA
jgi:ATP-binding cassette subfamily B protein